MQLHELDTLIASSSEPVILLEGRRSMPEEYYGKARKLAAFLTSRYPQCYFRSGNAEGSDEAFSKGVADVDPERLQIVAPYASHRKKARIDQAVYESPERLSWVEEESIAEKTMLASPKNKGLIKQRAGAGRTAAKAAYLIRDTMKVTGFSDEFPKTTVALFYIDPKDPMSGGTGHTVRVCQAESIPYAFQDAWETWVPESSCS